MPEQKYYWKKKHAEKYAAMQMPPCFDSKQQWVLWIEKAKDCHPKAENSYCEDCKLEYQAKMIFEGRCTNPEFRNFNNVLGEQE
jgi:hypothetical protein